MQTNVKLYIQAMKHSFESEFQVVVSTFKMKSDQTTVLIDIDDTEVEVSHPNFTQADFTNGHVDQLRKVKEELLADTHQKAKSLDEQIENLLAIESKVES